MAHCYFPWSKTDKTIQNKFRELPLHASVTIEKIQRCFHKDDQIQSQFFSPNLQLQLRQNLFGVVNTINNLIIDTFQCQPSVFVLIKQISQAKKINCKQLQNQSPNVQGLIKFVNKNIESRSISFYVTTNRRKILELYRIIAKTYTIQLDFHQLFKPIKVVGRGLTSTVYQAIRAIDNTSVAIKAFKKSAYFPINQGRGQKAFLKEFKMLTQCSHENICNFQGVYQTQNTIYIVQEYYQKTLCSLVFSQEAIDRKHILGIIEDLLKGLSYLHSLGIFHRDIKLQNIMFRKDKNNTYKSVIIDLGLAQYDNAEEYLFQKCGTPGFVAPEVFVKGAKSSKCDIFSLGVIFYMMLFKARVFVGASKEELIQNNRDGKMQIDMKKIQKEEQLVGDLLLKMLQIDEQKRISAYEALRHPIFSKSPLTPKTMIHTSELSQMKQEIRLLGEQQLAQ